MDSPAEIDRQIFNTLKVDLGEDFFYEMIETFCDDTRKQLDQLKSALDQGDSKTFTRAAHTVKSTSLIFGAVAFGNLARELEMLGRDGQLEASHEKYQQLEHACEPLLRAIRNLSRD